MLLDFTNCKTPKDVEKVFAKKGMELNNAKNLIDKILKIKESKKGSIPPKENKEI